MNETLIAARYARGLAEHAHEQGELKPVRQDLHRLADLLDPNRGEISAPELVDFLRSPTVPQNEKIQVTDVVCEKLAIGKTVSDFLNVLIRRNRIALIEAITQQYDRFAGAFEATRNAEVETARPLGEAQRQALEQALAQAAGAPVRMTVKVNPRLIAGLSVRMGDTLLDGSLRSRLRRLTHRLTR